jgi:hypothetical protein
MDAQRAMREARYAQRAALVAPTAAQARTGEASPPASRAPAAPQPTRFFRTHRRAAIGHQRAHPYPRTGPHREEPPLLLSSARRPLHVSAAAPSTQPPALML